MHFEKVYNKSLKHLSIIADGRIKILINWRLNGKQVDTGLDNDLQLVMFDFAMVLDFLKLKQIFYTVINFLIHNPLKLL